MYQISRTSLYTHVTYISNHLKNVDLDAHSRVKQVVVIMVPRPLFLRSKGLCHFPVICQRCYKYIQNELQKSLFHSTKSLLPLQINNNNKKVNPQPFIIPCKKVPEFYKLIFKPKQKDSRRILKHKCIKVK